MNTVTAASRPVSYRAVGWLAILALLAAVLLGPSASPVLAVVPTEHAGNITACPTGYIELAAGGGNQADASGGVSITLVYSQTQNVKDTLAFTATGGVVNIAFIKGGDNYYEYNYGAAGSAADTGLRAPNNNGGNQPTISHSVFCATKGTTTTTSDTTTTTTTSDTTTTTTTSETETETTTTTSDTSTTTTSDTPPTSTTSDTAPTSTTSSTSDGGVSGTTSSNSTPTGSVSGTTGTGSVTLPATSTEDPANGGHSAVISFGLLLLAVGALVLGLTRPFAPRRIDQR